MGNAISFRLNPKSESDRKILAWLEEKSSQPGYLNQTELIKQALLNAMESEQRGIREKETIEWMEQAIKSMAEELSKVVQESSQNVANNMFAGVLGAIASYRYKVAAFINVQSLVKLPFHLRWQRLENRLLVDIRH